MNPYVLPGTTEKLTMSLIAECVADFYGQDARTIFENKSRKSDYLHPRQLVQAVLVFYDFSILRIAEKFSMNHNSVYHNVHKVYLRMHLYKSDREIYNEALQNIGISANELYNKLKSLGWIQRR